MSDVGPEHEPWLFERRPMSEWQPISTAPKDAPVLVALSAEEARKRDGMHGRLQVAANRGMGWISIPGRWQCQPTHWMPLPKPPSAR